MRIPFGKLPEILKELRSLNDKLNAPDKKTKLARLLFKGDDALLFELKSINNKIANFDRFNSDLSTLIPKLDNLSSIEEKLLKIANIRQIKGDKGDKPVAGIDYPIPRDGEDGKDPDIKEIVKRVLSKIKLPKDGEDGKDCDEKEIIKQVLNKIPTPKNGRPPKHEVVGNSIRFENPDGTWGEWIHLGEMLGGGRTLHRGGVQIEAEDLTSQCNGVTKTFTVSYPIQKVLTLTSTQFPIIYRRDIDFTSSGTTITLTDEVGAPQTGQTLDITYIRN